MISNHKLAWTDELQNEACSRILSLHLLIQFAFKSGCRKSVYNNKLSNQQRTDKMRKKQQVRQRDVCFRRVP